MLRQQLRERLTRMTPTRIGSSSRTRAAVLIPFFDKGGTPCIIFTKRTDHVATHRGEICFPGGVMEETDSDLLNTALREVEEELAIPAANIEILGSLDEIRTVSSNFLVVPYVGYLKEIIPFSPNEWEVSEVLEIPFEHFTDPGIFHEETRVVDNQRLPVYFYQWESHMIWGVTGRILKSLLDLMLDSDGRPPRPPGRQGRLPSE
ncbi:CoA pyrophosphatase [bacterium]|nr:CoA pyrophosphatase [bacterium]